MAANREFWENSEAVQAHLSITQSVIQRMASNSSSCKAWCITLVSAILVVIADKGKPQLALLPVIPTVLFLALDCYYLALEKLFRNSYNDFINKLHKREVTPHDLYAVVPAGSLPKTMFSCLRSFSIWPFYLTLLAMIWVAKVTVL